MTQPRVEIKFRKGDIPRAIRKFTTRLETFRPIMAKEGLDFVKDVLVQSEEIVPVKFGNLKATGDTRGPQKLRNGFQVQIKYGGNAGKGKTLPRPEALAQAGGGVSYASAQHLTNPNGGREFMTKPFLGSANDFYAAIRKGINRIFQLRARGAV